MMELVHPRAVLEQVAVSVPSECHPNIVVIGSLAVAYHLLAGGKGIPVRTKDVDCVLSPRIEAVGTAETLAQALLDAGWHPQKGGRFGVPGAAGTPDDQLPVVRFHPPDSTDWFIELLTEPSDGARGREWSRLVLAQGHYALPSFQFLSIATYGPVNTEFGLRCARPEMMALANLLENPMIKPDLIAETEIKRSNKDLGRVLAIAFLSEGLAEDVMATWPSVWEESLRDRFPEQWQALAAGCGKGLRELLASSEDGEQARETCNNGILAHRPVTGEELRLTGLRLIQDAIEPLESV